MVGEKRETFAHSTSSMDVSDEEEQEDRAKEECYNGVPKGHASLCHC